MSDIIKEKKQVRYAKKRMRKPITIDMYLDDPSERNIYEAWKNEKHKKELFMKLYSKHLSENEMRNK